MQKLWKKNRLLHLEWKTLGHCVDQINKKIEDSGFQPTTIVGISRGGLGLASFLANHHHIEDFYAISVKRNLSDNKFHRGVHARFDWLAPQPAEFSGKRVLVADDITGDWETLFTTVDILKNNGAEDIRTAVIAKNVNSEFDPDFKALTVDDWLIFPWERLESVKDMPIEKVHIAD